MGKPWLKLWTDTLHDRKLARLAPAGRWAWVGLLLLAAETDDDGKLELSPGVPLEDADITEALHISPAEWTEAKAHFLRMGMIAQDGGALTIVNYAKRQASKDPTAAERMRNMRARSGVTDRNVTRNVTRKLRVEEEEEEEVEEEAETAAEGRQTPRPDSLSARYSHMVNAVGQTNTLGAQPEKFRDWFGRVAESYARQDFDQAVSKMAADYRAGDMGGLTVWQRTEQYLRAAAVSSNGHGPKLILYVDPAAPEGLA